MSDAVAIKNFGMEKFSTGKTISSEQWIVSANLSEEANPVWQELFKKEWAQTRENNGYTTVPEIAFKKKNMVLEVPCLRIETQHMVSCVKNVIKKTNSGFPEWAKLKEAEAKTKAEAEAKAKLEAETRAKAGLGSKAEVQKEEKPQTQQGVPDRLAITPKIKMKIGLVYGSSTGNTSEVAEIIEQQLENLEITFKKDVVSCKPEDLIGAELLIVGIPTWNTGELQEDWQKIYDQLGSVSLKGTKIAMFGLGDAVGYPKNFLDAMGMLYLKLLERGAQGGIGFWPTEGYTFDISKAVLDPNVPKFCGLGIDKENQSELTKARIHNWLRLVLQEVGIIDPDKK